MSLSFAFMWVVSVYWMWVSPELAKVAQRESIDQRGDSIAISFWNTEADERKYDKELYPAMVKTLSDTFEGTPDVRRFEVANSTM